MCMLYFSEMELRSERIGFTVFFLFLVQFTQRLHSSSFLGLPYKILNINHENEPLWSLWGQVLTTALILLWARVQWEADAWKGERRMKQ